MVSHLHSTGVDFNSHRWWPNFMAVHLAVVKTFHCKPQKSSKSPGFTRVSRLLKKRQVDRWNICLDISVPQRWGVEWPYHSHDSERPPFIFLTHVRYVFILKRNWSSSPTMCRCSPLSAQMDGCLPAEGTSWILWYVKASQKTHTAHDTLVTNTYLTASVLTFAISWSTI